MNGTGINQSRLGRWGPVWSLGNSQSSLHVRDAVAQGRVLAACKVSSSRGCVFQELGVLLKYPTSVNFHSTFLWGIPHTYRHELIHPLFPSEAGWGPAWLPLLNMWGNRHREGEKLSQVYTAATGLLKGTGRSGPMPHTGSLSCLWLDIVLGVKIMKEMHILWGLLYYHHEYLGKLNKTTKK